jgi:Flp pilus assembly protein TadD/glycosyltransferase involved in cell wall biosynthesis
LLIVHVEPPYYASQEAEQHVYRTEQPCRSIGALANTYIASGSFLTPAIQTMMWSADLLILCDTSDADYLPILAHRRARGLPTIFEINSNISVAQPWIRGGVLDPREQSTYYQLASQAETLIFATSALAENFEHLATHCEILPSQLRETFEAPSPPNKAANDGNQKIRIGWGGSRGQREDIIYALPALRRILENHPEATLAIMANPAIEHHFANIPSNQLEFHMPGALEEYVSFLKGLDIGIAPLLPSEFNHCRHDVKFLEYAATSTVPVCSNLPVYRNSIKHGDTGLLFDSEQNLEVELEKLLTNKASINKIASNAYHHVQQHRMESQHAHKRMEIYEEACSRARMLDTSSGRRDSFMTAYESHEEAPTYPKTRYRKIKYGRMEKLLYNGQASITSDLAERIHNLERARDLEPEFYLPHLWLGKNYPEPDQAAQALRQARELSRKSCSVYFELAKVFEEAGDIDLARRTMRQSVENAPTYAVGLDLLADYALLESELIAAERLRQRALEANPWYRVPARKLAQAAWDEGRMEVARKLLQENIEHSQPIWTDHYLLGQIYASEHRYENAVKHLEKAQDLEPDSREILTTLSRVYLALGKPAEAKLIMAKLKQSPRRNVK